MFESTHHGAQAGTLVKLNQRTLAVQTDDGGRWKASPQVLSPVVEDSEASQKGKVVNIRKDTNRN